MEELYIEKDGQQKTVEEIEALTELNPRNKKAKVLPTTRQQSIYNNFATAKREKTLSAVIIFFFWQNKV